MCSKHISLHALQKVKHIALISLSLVLLTAQLAPFGMQLTDMEFIENISMEETETEKKEKEKELEEEEKEKFSQYHLFTAQIAGLDREDCSSLTSMIPPAPYLEISSPPPDLFWISLSKSAYPFASDL